MRHLLPVSCALLFGLFHVATVVRALVTTHGSGEGQGLAVFYLDWPLVLLLEAVGGGGILYGGNRTAYVAFFSIAGTLMYLAAGYGVGLLVRFVASVAHARYRRLTPADIRVIWRGSLTMAGWFMLGDIAAFFALALLSVSALQNLWTGLHAPGMAFANAIVNAVAPPAEPMPIGYGILFVVLCLVQPAVMGIAAAWFLALGRARAPGT